MSIDTPDNHYRPINDDVIVVYISGVDNHFYPCNKDSIGSNNGYLPSRYVIKDNKLFYWRDVNQVITEELMSVLRQYNFIDSTYVSKDIRLIGGVINDERKGATYYFCKNNLKHFKKTGMDNILRRYKVPKLNCKR